MAKVSKAILKTYFEDGKEPDENKFIDLIDTLAIDDAGTAYGALIGAHLALPGLKAFWPMSVSGGLNFALFNDLAGMGLHLSNVGVQVGYVDSSDAAHKISIANFGLSGTDRLYRADAVEFQIIGSENKTLSSVRGLTMGGWFKPINWGNANQCLMGQWNTGADDRAYMIYGNTSSQVGAYISYNGIASTYKLWSASMEDGEWYHIVHQWSPYSDFLRIWVNGLYQEHSSPDIMTLHNSSAKFGIAHSYTNDLAERYFYGNVSMAFLCGINIHARNIERLYENTRMYFRPDDS